MAAIVQSQTDRDELLARLLADFSDQARQGRRPDVDTVAARHPELATELRHLWAAAQFADAFARPSTALPPTPPLNITSAGRSSILSLLHRQRSHRSRNGGAVRV